MMDIHAAELQSLQLLVAQAQSDLTGVGQELQLCWMSFTEVLQSWRCEPYIPVAVILHHCLPSVMSHLQLVIMHQCRGDIGALEDSLLSQLGAVRQGAAVSMRELHNSMVAILQRTQQEHASPQGRWLQQRGELQEQLHAAQQHVEELQSERTAAGALTDVWKTRVADMVRKAHISTE